jgi:hypothetical protein
MFVVITAVFYEIQYVALGLLIANGLEIAVPW